MKNKKLIRRGLLVLALSAIGVIGQAQSADELLMLSMNDVQGTARYSGMGGAFTALGGDFGALSVNPAGIGLYRKSEFSITPTITNTSTSTTYLGSRIGDSRVRFGLSNLGYIGTNLRNKTTGLVSVSYALGYNKVMDYHRSAPMQGLNSLTSIVDSYEETANREFVFGPTNNSPNGGNDRNFIDNTPERDLYNEFAPNEWTAVGAVRTLLLDNRFNNELPETNSNPNVFRSVLKGEETVSQSRHSWRSGSVGEYVMSLGANISNKIYLGATLGMQDLRHEEVISFSEDGQRNLSAMELDVDEFLRTTGFGINGKFGVIVRPIDEFRLGFAVHTPTFFELEESYSFNMRGNSVDYSPQTTGSVFANTYRYRMQSPYRLEFGLAYTIKQRALLSIDYELVGNNAMRMRDNQFSSHVRDVNTDIRNNFRASSNVRVGLEGNVGNGFLVRGGFNFIQSPYNNSIQMRDLGISSSNFNRYVYACGLGYRTDSFFADFAYSLNVGNYYYQPYTLETRAVSVATERELKSRFMLTMGFRF